jgi:hypothetical protein
VHWQRCTVGVWELQRQAVKLDGTASQNRLSMLATCVFRRPLEDESCDSGDGDVGAGADWLDVLSTKGTRASTSPAPLNCPLTFFQPSMVSFPLQMDGLA